MFQAGYTLDNVLSECVACSGSSDVVALAAFSTISFVGLCAYLLRSRVPKPLFDRLPLSVLKHLDRGKLKILWTTFQLLSTISWNLSLAFPYPFSAFLLSFSFLQLDFLSVECIR